MHIDSYDRDRDHAAMARVWEELSWLGEDGDRTDAMDAYLADGETWVVRIDGAVESFALGLPARLRYQDRDLEGACVAGVATSRIARRQGLAGQLTAHLVARQASAGAAFATLGAFDQGYYDRFGFGTGAYDRRAFFDPAALSVPPLSRPPMRLTVDHVAQIHAARLRRHKRHGAVDILSESHTRGELLTGGSDGFGLGFHGDAPGEISHLLWFTGGRSKAGPYVCQLVVFESLPQLIELLGLLRGFGDQIRSVELVEPPGFRLQDVLARPFRQRDEPRRPGAHHIDAYSNQQHRILDLPACVGATSLSGPEAEVAFQLALADPIVDRLPADAAWRGIGGEWVIRFGRESSAARGRDDALPLLRASVGAFTRLWLGVVSASVLAAMGELSAPPELLGRLDALFQLPPPRTDWEY